MQVASAGKVEGAVLLDGAALPGVDVILRNGKGKIQELTDEKGRFAFYNVPPGTYSLESQLEGLKPRRIKRVIVAAATTTRLKLAMELQTIDIVCTHCGGPPLAPDGPSFVVSRDMFDKLPIP